LGRGVEVKEGKGAETALDEGSNPIRGPQLGFKSRSGVP